VLSADECEADLYRQLIAWATAKGRLPPRHGDPAVRAFRGLPPMDSSRGALQGKTPPSEAIR
jgi:hypothetical protein